jgi:hypothetical protein
MVSIRNGFDVAVCHRYVKPDGTVGASAKTDLLGDEPLGPPFGRTKRAKYDFRLTGAEANTTYF